eukprot:12777523-Alexandrium_andersonii.AAC.1
MGPHCPSPSGTSCSQMGPKVLARLLSCCCCCCCCCARASSTPRRLGDSSEPRAPASAEPCRSTMR